MPDTQYIRKLSVIVTQGERGLDLSAARCRFNVNTADVQTPNTADVWIYNLSELTSRRIGGEFTRVTLQAGYENGNFGVIFDGTIKQVRRGRESATDTYTHIQAADGDIAYNFGIVNQTLAAGTSPQDRAKAIGQGFTPHGVTLAPPPADMAGGILPRGKVLYGMAREMMRDLAQSTLTTWSIQNGVVTIIPMTSYLPTEAVVITSKTGMIGLPEQTDNGIYVRCLLNPRIEIGTRVKLDNKSIQQMIFDLQYTAINLPATLAADGMYRVLVAEHRGDNRGNDWYTDLVCLSVDPTAPANSSVKLYG